MLTVNDLSVKYPDGALAIDSVRFAIGAGENVALIGANGAGKTTLLLALVGILLPSGGDIRIRDIEKRVAHPGGAQANEIMLGKKTLRDARSLIGMVFQNPDDQLFMPSIYDDVAFGLRNFGCGEEEVANRVGAALSSLGIDHLAERSPLKLSGGEKRLAAIASVLSMDPQLLLFDEPTAFLDPRARRNLIATLSGLPQAKLIATHDLAFAQTVCPRALLLQKGKLVADVSSIDILHDAAALEAAGL